MTPFSRSFGSLLSHGQCCRALRSPFSHSRLVQASISKASGLTEKKILTIEHQLLKDSETNKSVQTSAIKSCAVEIKPTANALRHKKLKVYQGSETFPLISVSEAISISYLH